MTRNQIILEARTWLRCPYHHQGRLKGVGVDCIGLVEGVALALGMPFVDKLDYNRHGVGPADLESELDRWCDRVPVVAALPGDVLAFWVRRPGRLAHCGFKTAQGLIHTHSQIGCVTEHGLDESWRKRLGAAWKFRGLTEV